MQKLQIRNLNWKLNNLCNYCIKRNVFATAYDQQIESLIERDCLLWANPKQLWIANITLKESCSNNNISTKKITSYNVFSTIAAKKSLTSKTNFENPQKFFYSVEMSLMKFKTLDREQQVHLVEATYKSILNVYTKRTQSQTYNFHPDSFSEIISKFIFILGHQDRIDLASTILSLYLKDFSKIEDLTISNRPFNTLIEIFSSKHKFEYAMNLYKVMENNFVPFSDASFSAIVINCRKSEVDFALDMLDLMRMKKFYPSKQILNKCISLCLEKAEEDDTYYRKANEILQLFRQLYSSNHVTGLNVGTFLILIPTVKTFESLNDHIIELASSNFLKNFEIQKEIIKCLDRITLTNTEYLNRFFSLLIRLQKGGNIFSVEGFRIGVDILLKRKLYIDATNLISYYEVSEKPETYLDSNTLNLLLSKVISESISLNVKQRIDICWKILGILQSRKSVIPRITFFKLVELMSALKDCRGLNYLFINKYKDFLEKNKLYIPNNIYKINSAVSENVADDKNSVIIQTTLKNILNLNAFTYLTIKERDCELFDEEVLSSYYCGFLTLNEDSNANNRLNYNEHASNTKITIFEIIFCYLTKSEIFNKDQLNRLDFKIENFFNSILTFLIQKKINFKNEYMFIEELNFLMHKYLELSKTLFYLRKKKGVLEKNLGKGNDSKKKKSELKQFGKEEKCNLRNKNFFDLIELLYEEKLKFRFDLIHKFEVCKINQNTEVMRSSIPIARKLSFEKELLKIKYFTLQFKIKLKIENIENNGVENLLENSYSKSRNYFNHDAYLLNCLEELKNTVTKKLFLTNNNKLNESSAIKEGDSKKISLRFKNETENEENLEKSLNFKSPQDISTLKVFFNLSKPKLSALVVLTTMCGLALTPAAFVPTLNVLFFTTIGTSLCVASANCFNQWVEPPFDAQMTRTRNRILVKRSFHPNHAFALGAVSGISGVFSLAYFVNPLTAALGLTNIILYAAVYTPMKRISVYNTHVGAIVGAIPPMMGWTAVTNSVDLGAVVLGAILYCWQFPHFNALSWNLRKDYSKAGYKMMSVLNPSLCTRLSLQYSLLLFPLCFFCNVIGITSSTLFLLDSSLFNGLMLFGAIKFHRNPTEKSARFLFFMSLIHLPVLLGLMIFHKKKDDDDDQIFLAE
ncbi:Protoheme IX farnesyltransferase, mitochondrial [Clydaea vesicula]|uniref:Protoheme IX farnesyltransferase, mitochondrial n=1 Tax=Clydaea vesicula TaxID=447962 RepID=A0AAD5Y128_9FUNG|nr:Protoheme IX farnesyltransferase, mitochondrial [Clydaea vesicula]